MRDGLKLSQFKQRFGMNKFILAIALGVLLALLSEGAKKPRQFRLHSKGIKCTNFNPKLVYNLTCRVKAVRGRYGLVDVGMGYNNVSDALFDIRVYYRPSYRAQARQPYLVSLEIEFCPNPFQVFNPLSLIYVTAMRSFDKQFDKCPLNKYVNISNFDYDDFIGNFDIPFLPEGNYIGWWRLHDKKNRTLFLIEHFVHVRPTGIHDISMMG